MTKPINPHDASALPMPGLSPRAQALLKPRVFGVYSKAHAKPVKQGSEAA